MGSGDCAGWRAVWVAEGAQGTAKDFSRRSKAGCRGEAAGRRIQTLRGSVYGDFAVYENQFGRNRCVWFYEVEADGWSLDDKRQPLLPEDKLGVVPKLELVAEEHAKNNLPDLFLSVA